MTNPSLGTDMAFWVLAATALAGALGVVLVRDIFRAALALVLAFLAVAGIFILLNAAFLGVVQALIYVGAIAILIIFVIMLTSDLERANIGNRFTAWALVPVMLLFAAIAWVASRTPWPLLSESGLPQETQDAVTNAFVASPGILGRQLLVDYVLPFEIAGVLLLAAVIGAMALVRSPTRDRGPFWTEQPHRTTATPPEATSPRDQT